LKSSEQRNHLIVQTSLRLFDTVKECVITMVQMRSVAGNPEGNIRTIERFVNNNPDSDIICFPEMCLSGYSTVSPERYALGSDDDFVQRIYDIARSSKKTIVFGYIERSEGNLYLRQEIVGRLGIIGYYRKSHLGIKESELFSAGNELPVFDADGVCIGIHLCTESHIPEISRTFRSKGAELILIPFANGISSQRRKEVWHSYLPARASDNGLYVAGCSAVGDNGQGSVFGGGLIILDPKGNVITEYYGDDEHSISAGIGGKLPRDGPETMMNISYFDRRRLELYR